METDAQLLRRYVEDRSEAAFTAVVARHLHLVYFAALRQVGGDARRAEEVAQLVFTDLARKARVLAGRDTLTGWLHTSTRFAAAKLRRSDNTRCHYEQEAMTMQQITQDDGAANWERVRPVIDEAIYELAERDREAVLLRFFEGRAFAEIGATLRLSEDAARMRVERALDKLRTALTRRGVNSTGAALALALANQVGAVVPAGMAASVAAGAVASAGGAASAAGWAIFMNKTSTVAAGAIAVATLGAVWMWRESRKDDVGLGQNRPGTILKGDDVSQGGRATDPSRAAIAPSRGRAEGQEFTDEMRRAMLTRVVMNQLRLIAQVRDAAAQSVSAMKNLPREKIYGIAMMLHDMKGVDFPREWPMENGAVITAKTRDGVVTYDPRGANATPGEPTPEERRMWELWPQVDASLPAAVNAHLAANGGKDPVDIRELAPYFATARQKADFAAYLEAQTIVYARLDVPVKEPEPKTPEEKLAQLNQRITPALTAARNAYFAANGGKQPPRREDLLPYFATPEQASEYAELIAAMQVQAKQKELERAPKTPEEIREEEAFQQLMQRVSPSVERAKQAYSAANGGKQWRIWRDLVPYLSTSEQADYAALRDGLETRMERQREGTHTEEDKREFKLARQMAELNTLAADAYVTANGGKKPSKWQDLLPYFATPEEAADFAEYQEARQEKSRAIVQKGLGDRR